MLLGHFAALARFGLLLQLE